MPHAIPQTHADFYPHRIFFNYKQLHELEPFFKVFHIAFLIADKYMENLKQASGEIWAQ